MSDDPTSRQYLTECQYRDSTNLDARIQIHRHFSTNPTPIWDWFFEIFTAPAEARILEVGCGKGSLWHDGRRFIAPGWSIVLADLSPGMLADARRTLESDVHSFEYCEGDIQALPFADAAFDVVIANFMLYHVPDRELAYREVGRVLRPGGRFYAATIGEGHMGQLDERISAINPSRTVSPVRFTLESGGSELRRHFARVEYHRYDDALEVTDAEAIVAYAQSGRRRLNDSGVSLLRSWAQKEIVTRGSVHIDKSIGMFVAQDPISESTRI